MFKNLASQSVTVLAVDTATNLPKTGDASNITLYYNGDNGGVTVLSTNSGHPTEDDATNAPGCYTIALTQGETNFNRLNVTGKSGTSGVRVVPILNLQTLPTTGILAPATAGRTLVVDASGLADANAVKVGPSGGGTAQTARDLGNALPVNAPGNNLGLPVLSGAGDRLAYTLDAVDTLNIAPPDSARVQTIYIKTLPLPASPAATGDAMTLTSGERDSIADAHIGRNIRGGSSTGRTVGQVYAAQRNKVAFDVPGAGQFTVYDTDDVTPLWQGTYQATPGANPVTTLDPT